MAVTVVARVGTFPGMTASGRPLLVAARTSLLAADPRLDDLQTHTELWARGEPAAILARLGAAGLETAAAKTAAAILEQPSVLALSWTFGFLLALGVTAGLVLVAGLLLYLQSRQAERDLAFALGRRMGLSDRAHRRAVTLELGAMLGVALVLGTSLATAAAALVQGKLDLLPDAPGPVVFAIPWLLFGITALALVLTARAGGAFAQLRARATNVSEVLRLAS